jgi:hypothetical protein
MLNGGPWYDFRERKDIHFILREFEGFLLDSEHVISRNFGAQRVGPSARKANSPKDLVEGRLKR